MIVNINVQSPAGPVLLGRFVVLPVVPLGVRVLVGVEGTVGPALGALSEQPRKDEEDGEDDEPVLNLLVEGSDHVLSLGVQELGRGDPLLILKLARLLRLIEVAGYVLEGLSAPEEELL